MTQEQINQKAEEYELTNGTFGFKEGVKWACIWVLNKPDGFIFNEDKRLIEYNGVEYRLEKKSYNLAKLLYDNKEKVLSREEICNIVWHDVIVEERTIDVHIRKIRKEIPQIPIETIKGLGYMWNE